MSRLWQGLVKLQEEAAELGVEAAKLSAYPEGEHPDGRGVCIDRVLAEMADVIAAIQFFSERHGLKVDWTRVDEKVALFVEWDRGVGMAGRGILERSDGEPWPQAEKPAPPAATPAHPKIPRSSEPPAVTVRLPAGFCSPDDER